MSSAPSRSRTYVDRKRSQDASAASTRGVPSVLRISARARQPHHRVAAVEAEVARTPRQLCTEKLRREAPSTAAKLDHGTRVGKIEMRNQVGQRSAFVELLPILLGAEPIIKAPRFVVREDLRHRGIVGHVHG